MVIKGEIVVLQCIVGGSFFFRLNWIKDDSFLVVIERYFFVVGNQFLIIVDLDVSDVGKYICEMFNILGIERGNVCFSVIFILICDFFQMIVLLLDDDGWVIVGVVIIVVVCCVVGMLFVWVVIIYYIRWRNEDCSIINIDEINLLVDIFSYLLFQGMLVDRQDGYVFLESGSYYQFVIFLGVGFFLL